MGTKIGGLPLAIPVAAPAAHSIGKPSREARGDAKVGTEPVSAMELPPRAGGDGDEEDAEDTKATVEEESRGGL